MGTSYIDDRINALSKEYAKYRQAINILNNIGNQQENINKLTIKINEINNECNKFMK